MHAWIVVALARTYTQPVQNIGWTDLPTQLPAAVVGAACAYDDDAWMCTGGGATSGVLPTVSVLVDGSWQNEADMYNMSSPRSYHTLEFINVGSGPAIPMVTGGSNATHVLDSVEDFVCHSMLNVCSWVSKPPMSMPRSSHAFVGLGLNRAMVLGGFARVSVPTTSTEIWNGTSWEPGTAMATPRAYHAAVYHNGMVMVTGGADSSNSVFASVEFYDTTTGEWTSGPSMKFRRMRHAMCIFDGRAVVTGGIGNNEVLDSVEMYDFASETWVLATPMAVPRYNHDMAALQADGGSIVVVGGQGDRGTLLTSMSSGNFNPPPPPPPPAPPTQPVPVQKKKKLKAWQVIVPVLLILIIIILFLMRTRKEKNEPTAYINLRF